MNSGNSDKISIFMDLLPFQKLDCHGAACRVDMKDTGRDRRDQGLLSLFGNDAVHVICLGLDDLLQDTDRLTLFSHDLKS